MKKFFTAVLLMVMGLGSASAQLSGSEVINTIDSYSAYYGFRVGYNSSNLRMSPDRISTDPVSGINFGFVAGFPLGATDFFFEPGLFFSLKGGKTKYSEPNKGIASNKCEVRMPTLEIPFVFKYDIAIPASTEIAIQPFFGGYMDYGFNWGKRLKHETVVNGQKEREKLKTFTNRFKRFDVGMRMGVGAQIDIFYVEFAYDLGLNDLGAESKTFKNLYSEDVYDPWDDTVKTGTLSISFGVNF